MVIHTLVRRVPILIATLLFLLPSFCYAWSSATHSYISQKAGIQNPQYSNFPDIVKITNYPIDGPYHWHDAAPNTVVTPDYIDQYQPATGYYVRKGHPEGKELKLLVPDPVGVLYWHIVQLYQDMKGKTGWEFDYYVFNIAHFVGDLSQPLHNFPHGNNPASNGVIYREMGEWSRANHRAFDSAVDGYLPLSPEDEKYLAALISIPVINSTDDLKKEISKIANGAIKLASKCYAEKRIITKEEAFKQIAQSVSLLKGITNNVNGNSKGGKYEIKKNH